MLKTSDSTTAATTKDVQAERTAQQLAAKLETCSSFPSVISVPIDIDPFTWLNSQTSEVKFAWSERAATETKSNLESDLVAGVGVAATVEAEPEGDLADVTRRCRERLQGNEEIRFYGGLSFDGADAWSDFGAGRFVVPRFLLKQGMLHLTVMDRDDLDRAKLDLTNLVWDLAEFATDLPEPTKTSYSPTADSWQSNVDEALTFIRSEVLEKVVLARKTTMKFPRSLNPIALTARMAEATHDCFVFCFQFKDGRAFVGATPERLFARQGNQLRSEVVAGTRPRGETSGEDQRLAYELLTSDKDQLEHDIVRKSIRQKLHKFVDHLDVDSHASVLRLARKQHLCSGVQGTLKDGIEDGDLLKRLHPTPAVGGYPTENALPEIARLEPFNRGWYAAPIGWIGATDAEFAVGIRSGLVEGDSLSLYSGAGIVKGSDPDEEWKEVDNKIRDFVDILGS